MPFDFETICEIMDDANRESCSTAGWWLETDLTWGLICRETDDNFDDWCSE
jgi:hypothetical protein